MCLLFEVFSFIQEVEQFVVVFIQVEIVNEQFKLALTSLNLDGVFNPGLKDSLQSVNINFLYILIPFCKLTFWTMNWARLE